MLLKEYIDKLMLEVFILDTVTFKYFLYIVVISHFKYNLNCYDLLLNLGIDTLYYISLLF